MECKNTKLMPCNGSTCDYYAGCFPDKTAASPVQVDGMVSRLTSSKKRDLALVAGGNMCSKTEPMPHRRMIQRHFYSEDGGSKTMTDNMCEKLKNCGLVEYADYYKDRHPDSGWTQWGRYVRITEAGSKLLGG